MIHSAAKPSPKSSRLAAMSSWLRMNGDHSTYSTDPETILYRIECRFPGGILAFDRKWA